MKCCRKGTHARIKATLREHHLIMTRLIAAGMPRDQASAKAYEQVAGRTEIDRRTADGHHTWNRSTPCK